MPVKRQLLVLSLTISLGNVVMWSMVHWFLKSTDGVIDTVDLRASSLLRAETDGQAAGVEAHVKPARSRPYNAQTEHRAQLSVMPVPVPVPVPVRVPEPTTAIHAKLKLPEHCEGTEVAEKPVEMKFRAESAIVKGESLMELESLVSLYRDCGEGIFSLSENPLGSADSTTELTRMRFDEMKYFFLQHSISIETVLFPSDYD
jgi:hypothetical protein